MTKPDPQPERLLSLALKLVQLWTKSTQKWQLKLLLSVVALLTALYGIGSVPSSEPSTKPTKSEPSAVQPSPSVQQKGDCSTNINGNSNTVENSRNCSPSIHSSFFGGLSGQNFHSESTAPIALYNVGRSASGQGLLLASHALPASGKSNRSPEGTAHSSSASGKSNHLPEGNATVSQPLSSVFLPIAIGFQRTEKFAGQMGASLFANAAPVGNTIMTGVKRVKHFAVKILEPERSEPSSAAPRSCPPGSH